MTTCSRLSLRLLIFTACLAGVAEAELPEEQPAEPVPVTRHPMRYRFDRDSTKAPESRKAVNASVDEVSRVDFVESAFGSSVGAIYAGLQGMAASNSEHEAQGGVMVGGSPLQRLSLHGVVGRNEKGDASPVVAMHVLMFGSRAEGFGIGALGQYKAEGFTEAGGEAELGLTAGWRSGRYHFDANVVGGLGVEEEEMGEVDVEGKLRPAYDVASFLRVGFVGQVRRRVSGERKLAGGREWDALGGPEVQAWSGPLTLALSGGPTTVGVADGVGAYAMLSVVGVSYF